MALATYQNLVDAAMDVVHATSNEIDGAAALNLVKSTAWEMTARGVLVTVTEELTTKPDTISAGMLYFKQLVELDGSSDYVTVIQRWRYHVYSDAGTPTLEFTLSGAAPANDLRLEGLGPITAPAALGNSVPEGIAGVFLQGLLVKMFGRLSTGRSHLARDRAEQRRERKVTWEETLNQMVAAGVERLTSGEYERIPGR